MPQWPVYAGPMPPARRSRWVLPVSVLRSDPGILQMAGLPPGPLPKAHVRLRKAGAFVTDVVVHLLFAAGATAAVAPLYPAGPPVAVPVGAYVAASLVHRVLLQALFQATAGKALTGLRVIRSDDGQPPGVAELLLGWLAGVALIALEILGNC